LIDFSNDRVGLGAGVALVDVAPCLLAFWLFSVARHRSGRCAFVDGGDAVDPAISEGKLRDHRL
jgi:hypothetical protein